MEGLNLKSAAAAAAAFLILGKVAMIVAGVCGRTARPTTISVIIPSVPSEPIIKRVRSRVVTAFFVALPSSII